MCYLDTDCGVTLDKASAQKILKMITSLRFRGIKVFTYETDKFVSISLYFPDTNAIAQPVYIQIHWELLLVERLEANLLISNNILVTENIVVDLATRIVMILSY